MSTKHDSSEERYGMCRLCSQPVTRKGKFGWYHNTPNLGAVHGVRPHFASPMAVSA